MSFVLVQHLAPDHESLLRELISRYTSMPVFEVEDGMTVQINCVYIIPPNSDMALLNGALQLIEPRSPHGQRLPIDCFFRSLAQDQHERALGIVLSGTASDGTLGLPAIKGEGGIAMVQSPESAEFDGMPRSAIATGLMDFELPPGEMPAKLLAYAARAFLNRVRPSSAPTSATRDDAALKKIFVLLRSFTGHDFSQYKPSTIRVWSAGCSTGEEAYSLAILLQERMEALGQSHALQIFGTDIDSRAIATARAGRPASIAADITPERLKRFFTPEPGGDAYRVHKSIRNLLIFSEHDLIKNPPFSKIDLVSCRNLLIYLNAALQKRIIPIFHYTMNPDGMLFLGTSETVGGFDE